MLTSDRKVNGIVVLAVALGLVSCVTGCVGRAEPAQSGDPEPCPTVRTEDIARFAANSPFNANNKAPEVKARKRLWADSCIWQDAPELVVEKWLTDKPASAGGPDTKGKYVLVEFWATWCPPCRRSISLLNRLHEKFGDELVVIGISDESEEDVRKLKEPKILYHSAIDTQKRMKNKLRVIGIPHVIIIEPGGCVVWEGFPLLKDYELTEEIVEKMLKIGRKQKAREAADKG